MTAIGRGRAKRRRRSAVPSARAASSTSSRRVSTSVVIRGRSASTRDGVKAAATGPRSRRWSAPSAVVMPGTVAKVRSGQPSGTPPSRSAVKWRGSLATSGWARNSRSSAWPRTAMPAISPGSTTRATGPRARSAALSACGQPPPGLIR